MRFHCKAKLSYFIFGTALAAMAFCGYSGLVGGECGASKDDQTSDKCVSIHECSKEVYSHLAAYKVSDDSRVDTEGKLLLARAGDVQIKSTLCLSFVLKRQNVSWVISA